MSLAQYLNGSLPLSEAWSQLSSDFQNLSTSSRGLLALAVFLGTPVVAIAFNVLWQLVAPRRRSDPPLVFYWLPFIGSAIAYGTDPIKFFFTCREKYGEVFTFVMFGRRITVALGPRGNNFILGGKSIVFNAEDAYSHFTTPVFGKDVVYDVPNDVFMEQKRFVKVGLSQDNFRAYIGMIEEEVEEFLKHDPSFAVYQDKDSNEWGSFDAASALGEITILTASRTLQGKEVRANLDKSFSKLYNDLDSGFTPLNFLFPKFPLPNNRRRDRAHKKMSKFYADIIKKRREGGSQHEYDMIEALMHQSYRNGKPLRDHEIAHMMITLLMAGQHTSASTGSWVVLHIAANPDIAEALYQEQVKYFGTPDGKLRPMTYEELRALPLMDSVIRETLRMHPPIHSIMRGVRNDVVIPPTLSAPSEDTTYVVPKGHWVLASPLISQIDPTVWRDSFKWDPYRWNDPEGVAAKAYAVYTDETGEKVDYGFGAVSKGTESPYQPFGAGRHRCIGEQFAYLQLGTIVTTLIRRLELRIDSVPEHNYHTMIVTPKTPRSISYRRRRI
ncbi:Lanosterol 14-alpha demethylase [Hypsizygus marmoreus]|uniref:Lanosterol 14-alpha demethylase n=1 Tax=Hypsizygus marmoreus TaxID=39966 RepID=A0A369JWP1_HYPMA|nr:Lanosterol 14-alpha demethylase [Hypsizygus marmoreus]